MTQYAGFWRRFAAYLIDWVILIIAAVIIRLVLADWLAGTITFFLGWLYFAGMESSTRQATLGKGAMGVFVTDMDGQRISFLRATGRYFAKWLSGLILMVGYIMAAFTARKQALHDILASTLVLYR